MLLAADCYCDSFVCAASIAVAGEYFLALMDTLSEGTKGLPCAEELKQVSEPSPPYVLVLLLPSLSLCACLPVCRWVGGPVCLS